MKQSEPVKSGSTGSSALGGPAVSGRAPEAKADAPLKPGPTTGGVVPPVGPSSRPPEAGKSTAPGAPAAAGSPSAGAAPLKPAATGSSAVPPVTGSKPADAPRAEGPVKAGATGSSAVRPEAATAGGSKPDAKADPKTGSGQGSAGQGTSRVTETATLAEGPILDLKAKRVPDPTETEKASPKPDAAKEAVGATAKTPANQAAKQPAVETHGRGGAGFGAVAASGLLGGLLGAGLLYGVTTFSRGGDSRAAIDKAVAGLATKDALATLDRRVASGEQALKPLSEAVTRADAAAKAAGEQASEALKKAGTAPAASAAAPAAALPADLAARLDALDQRVSALQEEPGRDGTAEVRTNPASNAAPEALAALDQRIKTLEAEDAKASPAQATDTPEKLAALQGEVASRAKANEAADAALAKRLDELQTSLESRVTAATQAVQEAGEASKQAVAAGQARADETARGLDRKLQEQSEKIASLDKALDQSAKATTVQSALRIVSADRIAAALVAGQPYPEALASLRNLEAPESKRLDALAAFADRGAPTASALAAEFRAIADKIGEAKRAAQAKAVAETGSVGDKLLNMASSIVQVKRVDAPAAAPAAAGGEASTGQVQAALDRGDLAGAAQAYASLPEEARAQGGDFGARLAARAEAGRAVQGILADAFTGLPPAR